MGEAHDLPSHGVRRGLEDRSKLYQKREDPRGDRTEPSLLNGSGGKLKILTMAMKLRTQLDVISSNCALSNAQFRKLSTTAIAITRQGTTAIAVAGQSAAAIAITRQRTAAIAVAGQGAAAIAVTGTHSVLQFPQNCSLLFF